MLLWRRHYVFSYQVWTYPCVGDRYNYCWRLIIAHTIVIGLYQYVVRHVFLNIEIFASAWCGRKTRTLSSYFLLHASLQCTNDAELTRLFKNLHSPGEKAMILSFALTIGNTLHKCLAQGNFVRNQRVATFLLLRLLSQSVTAWDCCSVCLQLYSLSSSDVFFSSSPATTTSTSITKLYLIVSATKCFKTLRKLGTIKPDGAIWAPRIYFSAASTTTALPHWDTANKYSICTKHAQ